MSLRYSSQNFGDWDTITVMCLSRLKARKGESTICMKDRCLLLSMISKICPDCSPTSKGRTDTGKIAELMSRFGGSFFIERS